MPDHALKSDTLRAPTFRGAEGFFRVAQAEDGRWWLVDPMGQLGWLAGLAVGSAIRPRPSLLRGWGFAAVVTGRPERDGGDGMVWLPTAGLSDGVPWIRLGGARLPDVFDLDWAARVAERAQTVCAPFAADPSVLGWRPDDGLDWAWDEPADRPTLLQLCLSLEPRFAAYHAAWEFVLALHEGRLDRMAEAWQVPLTNKELLRAWTSEDRGVTTAGYRADHRLWTEQCARRYLAGVSAALRAAAPQQLRFGPSLGRSPTPPWWPEIVGGTVDVLTLRWAPGLAPAAVAPVWVEDFAWTDPRLAALPPQPGETDELTRVERMLARGRGELRRLAQEPAVVGWSWMRPTESAAPALWADPSLVDDHGEEVVVHTEALAWVNRRAPDWRRSPPPALRACAAGAGTASSPASDAPSRS